MHLTLPKPTLHLQIVSSKSDFQCVKGKVIIIITVYKHRHRQDTPPHLVSVNIVHATTSIKISTSQGANYWFKLGKANCEEMQNKLPCELSGCAQLKVANVWNCFFFYPHDLKSW